MSPADGDLRLDQVGAVLQITIDRPEARNALNRATRVAFVRVCAEADRDPDVSAVVLTGTDPAFSAGVDLKEVLSGQTYHSPRTNPGKPFAP